MAQAAIRSTVTQKVRGFLGDQGVGLTPWTGVDDIYAELYGLMNRRRDDPAFWPHVTQLLDGIVKDVTDPESPRRLATPQAELLSSWDVRSLVADLRKSLPGGDAKPEPGAVRRFGQKLSAQLLGGFLLLGLAAAGCKEESDDGTPDVPDDVSDVVDAADDGGGLCPGASGAGWADSCALAQSTELWCTIATSTAMDTTSKASLCSCFVGLNDSWRTGLAGLFATADAPTVARALTEMLNCVCPTGTWAEGLRAGDYQNPTTGPYSGSLCEPAPLYKGAIFGR
jgi:hypothetical protein